MKIKLITLIVLMASPLTLAAGSKDALTLGDAKKGAALHQRACVACHTTSVYTRPDRIVNSYSGLVGRVNGCNMQLNLNLDPDRINDLVAYLNSNFYKLDPEK